MWSSNANGVDTSYAYDALNRLETISLPISVRQSI
jgi:YD repeat-containing protein